MPGLSRLEEGTARGHVTRFARHHYERFWRTANRMGWKPITSEDFTKLMKSWSDGLAAVLNDQSESPFFKLARKKGFRTPFATKVTLG